MRGARIMSAYDPDIVRYRGRYIITYECTLEDDHQYDVDGTSSCVSLFDPISQSVDLSHTQVVVSGNHTGARFYAAAVPELLVFHDRLLMYWSSLTVDAQRVSSIAIRAAELELSPAGIWVRGAIKARYTQPTAR